MKKKILSLILAFAMVLPLCPAFELPVFAEKVVSVLAGEENKGEEDQSELKADTISQTNQLATASTSKVVLGTDGKITRAEWLHNLVYVFNMTAEATSLPDNYFSDLDNSHKYYGDILLAVEFGVVDVEAGGILAPDAFVTREYAATTLNFCLGYQLEEDVILTFSDATDCQDPVSAQIALNRGWFELVDGKFSPAILVTEEEVKTMMDDAAAVLEKQVVDTGYDNTYEFAEGVIVLPDTVIATEDENGVVSITDCPERIAASDKFAVFYNGIPVVYTAQSVTVNDNVTVIETESVEAEAAFTEVDAQGVISAEDIEIIPADGVEMEIQEENISTFSSRATKKIKNISFKKPIKITKDITANFSVKINNPYVEYIVETDYAYVALNGETTIEYGATFDADSFAGIESSIPIFKANIGGVGSFDVTIDYDFGGSVKGTVEGYLIAGLECSKNDGLRAVKHFSQSDYYTTVDATADVSLKASLGITKMPIIKGNVYARVGARSNFNLVDYSSGTPDQCVSFSGYLYAKYGASASAKIGSWSKTFSKDFDIYTKSNSPVRIEHHYEDDVPVAHCTRGSSPGSGSGSKYYTKSNSKWSGSGWSGANSAYGLSASGTSVALYEYSLNEKNNATITKYKGNSSYVSIPETIDGYTVTKIAAAVFGNTNLIGVTLPDTIVEIGQRAFAKTAITSIHIPKSLDYCGTYNNYSCTLNGITYSVADGPFVGCNDLKNVTFETGITQIPSNLLAGCTGIESVTIPDSVTVIEWSAFEDCLRLKDVKIGNSVTEIGGYAFEQCISLEEIIIPDSVTDIESGTFKDCYSLSDVTLSKALTTIGNRAFAKTAITDIHIPKSLDYCGTYNNYSCTLNGITYSVTDGPFVGCNDLKNVTFETGITQISQSLLAGCTGIESITIPDSVTVIEWSAFEDCLRLKDVKIGNSVTEIGGYAFEQCISLEEIIIPDSVTKIGSSAFENCTNLSSIELPESLTSIGNSAFENCLLLKELVLPNKLKDLNSNLFYNCTSLEKISLSESISTIGASAFYNCSSLKEIVIPEKVKSISSSAFQNCTSLEKVTMPNSIKTLGSSAFMGCESLKDVSIADYSIIKIESNTFKDCPALQSIVLPKGLTSIGSQAFMNDTSLVNVTIPESVTTIDNTAFSYPAKTTIYGRSGSYAETFATNGGFTFKDNSIPVEGMILKDGVENVTIDVGETYRAEFEVYPEDANDVITLTANNTNVTINGHDIYARYAGDTVITATSTSGLTYEFSVHVRSVKNIQITSNPTKTSYLMGEEFDKNGMVVQVNYNDGTSKIVEDYTIAGFDSSREGTVTLTVKWVAANSSSYSKTLSVTIIDPTPKLTGIYIETLPAKLRYNLREKLDTAGMIVMGTYTDGSTKEITNFTVSGYNALKAGRQTITVTFGDFTTSFIVAVGITMTDISIESSPYKTEYFIGDSLISDGLKVLLTYSDGVIEPIATGFTVSGFDSTTAGTKTVTVTYGDFSANFTVTVKTPFIELSSKEMVLTLDSTATLTATASPKGQIVTWSSDNPEVATVENGVVIGKTIGSATITAQFIYNGVSYSQSCKITVVCSHAKKTLTPAKIATCSENGWDAYYTCNICEKLLAKDGITVLTEIPTTDRNPNNHTYDNAEDLFCNECGYERPPFTPGDLDGVEGVSSADAIYLLYYTLFGEERYPVNQPVDYDKSGKVDSADAIYLLYHTLFGATRYPL